jgi:hypothetical protein
LKNAIADVCKKHDYLSNSEKVNRADLEIFEDLMFKRASDNDVQGSLLTITRMMAAHYGKPVILLIDEYDVPLAKANEEKEVGERYYPQMLEILRGLLSTALKSNEYLKFGIVTGCLRIAKESIFTGVNNFKPYSVLDRRFSTYIIDMVIAGLYHFVIFFNPVNEYTTYLLTEIWIRPTLIYGLVACFVTEKEDQ